VRCPHCGDWMVAPAASEFVEGVEIRHYWECDSCGETSSISIPLTRD
jgi:rRNA maturation protein Nop10